MWARTPLRIKLVAALLVLVAGALALSSAVASASLRRYLFQRVDEQLVEASREWAQPRRGGRPGGPRPPLADRDGPRVPQRYHVRLATGAGTVVAETEYFAGERRPDLPPLSAADVRMRGGRPFTVGSLDGAGSWRAVAVTRPNGGVAVLARDLADETATVRRLAFLQLVVGVVVLAGLGGIGYVVVRRSLRPLAEVETTAAAIAAGDLTRRVPEADPRTEVGAVAAALNAMLQQIETAFRERSRSEAAARRSEQRMRQFVADASHELRTPLTSIRGFAELYRQGAAPPEELPGLMRRIEDEGARMGLLVDDLLLLARLDEQRPLATERVDLVALAADVVHAARAVAPDRAIELAVAPGTGAVEVVGDEPRLRQVLANLVTNAVRHTPPATPVEVRLRTDGDAAVADVVDRGPGLSPEDAQRVFERFYRADAARTHAAGGTGLGLAIVAALTAAHGGTVAVGDTPGGGATFTVRLPLAGPAPAAAGPARAEP